MKNRSVHPKILYIGDKWCSGNLQFGISEWEGNLWKSLKSTHLADVELFHFDDYYYQFKKPGDEALIKKIIKYQPDIICLVIYRMPGSDFNVPKWKTLNKIKDYFKIPIMAIWGDLEIQEQIKIYKALLPYTTINAATASSAAVKRINNPEKCIYMWVPKDPEIFNNPKKRRDIDMSYLGSLKKDRLSYINYLIKNNVSVFYGGGEREEHLSTQKYADMLKQSKMTLSFSRAHCSHVINARLFEAMNCGAMVLEEESFETPKLFVPFVDYVPYVSREDLLEKARYFRQHDKEREKIANNGYQKTLYLYSAKHFWQLLIDRVLKTSSRSTNNLLFLKSSNLSHLSRCRSLKLKSLNIICSNNIGFRFYKTIMIIIRRNGWGSQLRLTLFPAYLFFQKRLSPRNFEVVLKVLRFIFRIKKRE